MLRTSSPLIGALGVTRLHQGAILPKANYPGHVVKLTAVLADAERGLANLREATARYLHEFPTSTKINRLIL